MATTFQFQFHKWRPYRVYFLVSSIKIIYDSKRTNRTEYSYFVRMFFISCLGNRNGKVAFLLNPERCTRYALVSSYKLFKKHIVCICNVVVGISKCFHVGIQNPLNHIGPLGGQVLQLLCNWRKTLIALCLSFLRSFNLIANLEELFSLHSLFLIIFYFQFWLCCWIFMWWLVSKLSLQKGTELVSA